MPEQGQPDRNRRSANQPRGGQPRRAQGGGQGRNTPARRDTPRDDRSPRTERNWQPRHDRDGDRQPNNDRRQSRDRNEDRPQRSRDDRAWQDRPSRDSRPSRDTGPSRDNRSRRDDRPFRDEGRTNREARADDRRPRRNQDDRPTYRSRDNADRDTRDPRRTPSRATRPDRDRNQANNPRPNGDRPTKPRSPRPTSTPPPDLDNTPEPTAAQPSAPELPEEAALSMLDPEVRAELRGLPKNLAEVVGRHLAAAGMLIDEDPELALEHARYARARAVRIGLVREAVGLTAYHAGEWAEALSELRAARRMSNGPGHIAIMADCERALGRPERALELAREGQSMPLPPAEVIELRIVAAGARRDMGQLEAAVVALQGPDLDPSRQAPWSARLFYAYADNLAASDRTEEAIRWFLNAAQADDEGETDAAERVIELSNTAGSE